METAELPTRVQEPPLAALAPEQELPTPKRVAKPPAPSLTAPRATSTILPVSLAILIITYPTAPAFVRRFLPFGEVGLLNCT